MQVVEDAMVDSPGRSRPPTPWVWIVVAFAVGLGSGAVFFGPVVGLTLDTAGANPDTPLVPGEPIGPEGLATALPGFPDAIVAIIETPDRNIEHLLWPQGRGPSTRPLPVTPGSTGELSVSGIWVGMTQIVPDSEGSLLSMGRPTGLNPVASGVGAFAWHDSASGTVGFTRLYEGRWGLWKATSFPFADHVADLGPSHAPFGRLAYGDWGWVVPAGVGVEVLDPDGVVLVGFEGGLLASHNSGLLLIGGSELVVVDVATGMEVRRYAVPMAGVRSAAFSPDGSRIAVTSSVKLAVLDVVGSGDPDVYEIDLGREAPVWSSDSRFVIVPAVPRGVSVIDTETGDIGSVLDEIVVRSVGVISLSGSS